jgi:asparagine synthase (glutamine-hydrolysing)
MILIKKLFLLKIIKLYNMCGILGILGKKDLLETFGLEKVKELSGRMAHRGPDEHDFHINDFQNIITHERLSIIDLHTGKQPIKGTNDAYVVHNGEIYNHQELRDGILKHHTFHTTCDSEVIVHLYEEFGDNI